MSPIAVVLYTADTKVVQSVYLYIVITCVTINSNKIASNRRVSNRGNITRKLSGQISAS